MADDTTGGLNSDEAGRRLQQDGPNSVRDAAPSLLANITQKFWSPVPWMLEVAIALQLALGYYAEASVVAVLLVANACIGLFQEGRARDVVNALRSRLPLNASVRRSGAWTTLPAASLVTGDVVKLTLGGIVPADVRLLGGQILLDQSLLTGESLPSEAAKDASAYAGALIRRGEATAIVTATGMRTRFGHTAELIRTARVESAEQKTVFHVVRNLAVFNGGVTVAMSMYASALGLSVGEIVPLVLVALLASIPMALPSMFTLAAAIGARALSKKGILPTRLSAVDEAAGIDVLCVDKTGTLTHNALAVVTVHAMPEWDAAQVLSLAALASSEGGADPVDAAIRAVPRTASPGVLPVLLSFEPFDPALKRASATARRSDGSSVRIVKGAFSVVATLASIPAQAGAIALALEATGARVLAVAAGPDGPGGHLALIGLIALSDTPRADSAASVAALKKMGIRTIMVTGDAQTTAESVAAAVGIAGAAFGKQALTADTDVEPYAIFSSVLPEDKFTLVKALQKTGHNVGMCGDGVNDSPALRQAQMGIAVSTASDVAKSAAGVVLTEAGLAGIVTLVTEGRRTFQRILTYTLRSIIHKVVQVLFLAAGLVMTGQAILTPMLMVLMMVTGDVLAMSSATDTVRPSSGPNVWRVRNLTIAGVILGIIDLAFCVACLAVAKYRLELDIDSMRSFTVVTLVCSGQAVFYVARERKRLWSSRPGPWLIASSTADLVLIGTLAASGVLMKALPIPYIGGVFAAAILLALLLDTVKLRLFRHMAIA